MASKSYDVLVLGGGIVGVATALQLQLRGRSVALIERRPGVAQETSYGNAGIIERASIEPYMFPRGIGNLLTYAFNRSTDARYHLSALPAIAPWLWRYYRASAPESAARIARAALPLIDRCLSEHEALMQAAGASHLLRKVGWIKLFRTDAARREALEHARVVREHGLGANMLDALALRAMEPSLRGIEGGVHYPDPGLISDPEALGVAYARHFVAKGGAVLHADARTLDVRAGRCELAGESGTLRAGAAVVALGAWSNDVLSPLGYNVPLGFKRGYHMHYGLQAGAALSHTVLDTEGGYCLAPMARGIRLTTGVEFGRRDAPPTPVQVEQCEPLARRILPLAGRRDARPWMGVRPCLPDMLPVLGPAPRHKGLWLNFGHQHHGLTLSAVTGRLLAEMMTGAAPFTDPAPYAVTRFGA